MLDLAAAFVREHSRVDIFREMETFLRLRESSARRHEDRVQEIGVTVVKLSSQVGHAPRGEGTEGLFLAGGNVSEDTYVLREDVLARSDDRDRVLAKVLRSVGRVRVLARDVVVLELAENVADLETLFEVVVLVRVDELDVLSTVEDDGVVLVVRLSVSENRVTGQLDAELGATLAVREDFRVTVDESREDAGFASLLAGTLLVEVGDLQVGVGAEQEFRVLDLLLGELRVALHRDEEPELAAGHAFEFALEAFRVAAKELNDLGVLDSVHELDRFRVVHESGHGAVEGLSSERSPDSGSEGVLGRGRFEPDRVERNIVRLLVRLLVEVGRLFGEDLRVADKVVPFDRVELLEVLEEGDAGVLIFFANDLAKG